ncbi:DMT family transporter [Acuticoccus mangrovi]|uniref:DMT family transporter n=1 Tax=Acuticoccus mangrovi TaxID=2796142 RepID=A0A934IME3_9HYPH|nr:DMT family transporter [Acuticoccus mangrovi]MBJ3774570.1 DMT family transporter [Acuticoccus mangrovi]
MVAIPQSAGATATSTGGLAERLGPNVVGALWMFASAIVLTLQAAVVKHLGQELPIAVILFLRVLMISLMVGPMLIWRGGLRALATRRPLGHLMRAVFGLGMMAGSFYAVTVLPLADATALSFTRPLWSMLTSYLAFGEVVGWIGGIATFSGFGGVLVIAQPQSGIHPGMIIAVLAAASSSLALVCIKRLTTTEPVQRILLYFALTGTIVLALPAYLTWQTPTLIQLGWLIAIAITGSAGQLMSSLAVKHGDMTVVTPIDFVRVPAAAFIGFLLFAELPDVWTFLGSLIIFGSTVAILRLRRRPPVAPIEDPGHSPPTPTKS